MSHRFSVGHVLGVSGEPSAERKRNEIFDRERGFTSAVRDTAERIRDERVECLKQWRELQSDQQQLDEDEKNAKENPTKYQKKYASAAQTFLQNRRKTTVAFAKFEQNITAANQAQRYYHTTEVPSLLRELEALESRRLTLQEHHMKHFLLLFRRMISPYDQSLSQIEQQVSVLNKEKEMRDFVKAVVSRCGLPPAIVPHESKLPCDSNTVDKADEKLKTLLHQDHSALLKSWGVDSSSSFSLSSFSSFFSKKDDTDSPRPVAAPAAAAAPEPAVSPYDPPADQQNLPPVMIVKAVFDFESTEETDISFKANDLVRVISGGETAEDGAWWVGRVLYTKSPLNHVVDLSFDPSTADPTTSAYDGYTPHIIIYFPSTPLSSSMCECIASFLDSCGIVNTVGLLEGMQVVSFQLHRVGPQ